MKIPKEAICAVCKQIFCCEKCCKKHELKQHAIRITRNHVDTTTIGKEIPNDIDYVLCPICANRPFPLREIIYNEMLEHIKRHHMPLHCQKCSKVYMRVDELRQFSKCMQSVTSTPENFTLNSKQQVLMSACCVLNTTIKSKIQQNTISTQTSPYTLVKGDLKNFAPSSASASAPSSSTSSALTPLSIVNSQGQSKTKAKQDISESVSSFKNFSLISNSTSLRHNIGSAKTQIEAKGKLVRTTSTPVSHTGNDSSKPREQTFNVSAGQVSSIYNSNSEIENENSPVGSNVDKEGITKTNPQMDAVNLYKKFNGRAKIAAVTPLRQVMSKSIQKAFAEHGLPSFCEQRKTTRETVSIYDANPTSPLDLRLSPALRRSQGDSFNARNIQRTKNVISQEQRLNRVYGKKQSVQRQVTTESIFISCTEHFEQFSAENTKSASSFSGNSVYETCQSYEIVTDLGESSCIHESNTKENADQQRCSLRFISTNATNLSSITPINRVSSNFINKKIIKFETPKVEGNNTECRKTPNAERFYTPNCKTPTASEENSRLENQSLSKIAVARNLSTRFSPSRRPSIRDCAQCTTGYCYHNVSIDEQGQSNDEVFLSEKTNNSQTTKRRGFLKSIVNSILSLPTLKDDTKLNKKDEKEEYERSTRKNSIIKRCASIAGTVVRSTSLMDEKQLQTLKRKRTHTLDSQLSPYKSACHLRSVSYLQSANELSSTKRFRIQPRKPIERMRNT